MNACLYCGKQMSVVKKLTGADQFCSEVHRQKYQEETNRLALDRLLNPKFKTKAETGGSAPRARATVAVEAGASGNPARQSGRAGVAHSRATAHHQFEASGPTPRNAAGVASERNVSDSRLDSELKAAEQTARMLPMAGPIATGHFCLPSGGGATIGPVGEGVLAYPRAIRRTNLDLRSLITTGFEDEAGYHTCTDVEWIEEFEPIVTLAAACLEPEPEVVPGAEPAVDHLVLKGAPKPIPPPVLMPAFQLHKQRAAAAAHNAPVFEPLGGFLEMEDDNYTAAVPAAAAPPPARAGAIQGLTFDLKPAEPIPGKVQQGFGEIASEPSSINAPALALSPLRKRLVFGPNPNAKPAAAAIAAKQPAATPVAQKAAPAQKPVAAPSVTVKSAASAAKPAGPAIVARPVPVAPSPPRPVVTQAPPVAKAEPIRPAAAPPAPARPAIAARDRSATAPVEAKSPDAYDRFPTLGMGTVNNGFWANASGAIRVSVAGVVLVILGLLGSYLTKSAPAVQTASATSPGPTSSSAAMSMGGGGWATNWGQDAAINKGKHIQIFRPSMAYTDYHIDLRGQIEKKAIGWIFRASNPKNYYVMKLEIVKPGREPVIALVKYAVINGKEQTHTQVMLPSGLPLTGNMEYRIRTDVAGNKFTTYVQDKLVDYWTDDTIKVGGAGLYSDKDERARVKSELITP